MKVLQWIFMIIFILGAFAGKLGVSLFALACCAGVALAARRMQTTEAATKQSTDTQ